MCLTPNEAKEYREYLLSLAETHSSDIISNGGKDHAIVLYSVLLDNSRNDVRIFCQSGSSAVWRAPEFIEAMNRFLKRDNTSLKVLTSEEPTLDRTFRNQAKVEIRHISTDALRKIKDHFKNSKCNFAIFDTDKYRYEYDFEHFKAYCSFNAPDVVKTMTDLFDASFSDSAPVQEIAAVQ